MKLAEDFRRIARGALKGKWFDAVFTGLAAAVLGGLTSEDTQIKLNVDVSELPVDVIIRINDWITANYWYIFAGAILAVVIYFLLGGFVGVGYARFNLNLIDRKKAAFENLFQYSACWKRAAATKFLKALYTILWSFLFLVPGIMAAYSYAMTDYILAENPELTPSEAIEHSKAMMHGKRWRLFCLEFSFIGWAILVGFTYGIGNLWLIPYRYAATAAFYREVSETKFYTQKDGFLLN